MSKPLILPENYNPILGLKQTEQAIKKIKDFFQLSLAAELRLQRVTAPLFVRTGTGINDELNGVERPVKFPVHDLNEEEAEIVQSLAKWKRMTLADLEVDPGFGIYADMNAIRPDEELGNMHSLFVDQWDWEKVITDEDRHLEYLKQTVRRIYNVMQSTEYIVYENFGHIKPVLPEEITFIHTEDLLEQYPDLSPAEREKQVVKKYGAVFLIGIGGTLKNGVFHDGRAPDYDDWSTPTHNGLKGLNGDILVWNPVLENAFELSSMGIRVNKEALKLQLRERSAEDKETLLFHRKLLNGELPLSMGGGIGQSRLCMFFLRKAHIGEIQVGIWPEKMRRECKENNIHLL